MKNLKDMLTEKKEFNPLLKSHRNVWNSFVNWYDKQLKYMERDEMIDMLKDIIYDIENDDLNEIYN